MAKIKSFQAIRPCQGMESKIAALPYDVFSRQEAKEEVKKYPDSFLKIDRPETLFEEEINPYSEEAYQKAHDVLWEMVEKGKFVMDEASHYYLYELTMEGRSQTGIVACASVDDYLNNVIKKHENTRADKEQDRINHVDKCEAQTGPIFLAYRSRERLNQIVAKQKKNTPIYDFVALDGVTHRVWIIEEKECTSEIEEIFLEIKDIYIADGHHRCASAVAVSLKRRKENPNYTGEESFNYFLSVLFPDDQLMVLDYNRVVKDLNQLEEETFLLQISEFFIVEKNGEIPYSPYKKGTFGMYLNHSWYKLRAKESIKSDDPVDGLDVSLLQNYLLDPILGIKEPKTDKRIDFVGGIRGLRELEKRVQKNCKVAFAMCPTSMEELFAVSDASRLMPPKSTWFEPKLRSGLFIHSIKNQ